MGKREDILHGDLLEPHAIQKIAGKTVKISWKSDQRQGNRKQKGIKRCNGDVCNDARATSRTAERYARKQCRGNEDGKCGHGINAKEYANHDGHYVRHEKNRSREKQKERHQDERIETEEQAGLRQKGPKDVPRLKNSGVLQAWKMPKIGNKKVKRRDNQKLVLWYGEGTWTVVGSETKMNVPDSVKK